MHTLALRVSADRLSSANVSWPDTAKLAQHLGDPVRQRVWVCGVTVQRCKRGYEGNVSFVGQIGISQGHCRHSKGVGRAARFSQAVSARKIQNASK